MRFCLKCVPNKSAQGCVYSAEALRILCSRTSVDSVPDAFGPDGLIEATSNDCWPVLPSSVEMVIDANTAMRVFASTIVFTPF